MTPLLVILYGIGGLSDVGRHAVRAALDAGVPHICVLTQHPELLELPNWKCGCPVPHSFTEEERQRFQVIPVDSWEQENNNDKNDDSSSSLTRHFAHATAVISCCGNRQPGLSEPELKQGWVAHEANQLVLRAMMQHKIRRVVCMSSVGVNEDWPPMESFALGKWILSALFVIPGLARRAYQDLTATENLYKESAADEVDYLLVRPVGLGDDHVPTGTWQLQKKKGVDQIGLDMAKMDCARFMVQEALQPALHRQAVVIGSVISEDDTKQEIDS